MRNVVNKKWTQHGALKSTGIVLNWLSRVTFSPVLILNIACVVPVTKTGLVPAEKKRLRVFGKIAAKECNLPGGAGSNFSAGSSTTASFFFLGGIVEGCYNDPLQKPLEDPRNQTSIATVSVQSPLCGTN